MLREIFQLLTSLLRFLFDSAGRSQRQARRPRARSWEEGLSPSAAPPTPSPIEVKCRDVEPVDEAASPAEQSRKIGTEEIVPPPSAETSVPADNPAEPGAAAPGEVQTLDSHDQSPPPGTPSGPLEPTAGGTATAREEKQAGLEPVRIDEAQQAGSEPEADAAGVAPETGLPASIQPDPDVKRPADTRGGRDEARPRPVRPRPRPEPGRGETLPPEKRGGRPRGPSTSGTVVAGEGVSTRPPQPELVCWEQGRLWYVGLELPKDIDPPSVEVLHGEVALQPEHDSPGRYVLGTLRGVISIRFADGGSEPVQLSLREPHLIFRLSGQEGRRVDLPMRGRYGIAAPEGWCWDAEHNGPPQFAPEPCSIDGFQMYVFDTSGLQTSSIAFLKPDGAPVLVRTRRQKFRLTGHAIEEDSRYGGPLFADVPSLEATPAGEWESVGTIVVGEEGPGQGRWRFHFQPVSGSRSQSLPPELVGRGGGWYFIRIYNREGTLLESLDFRFLVGLDRIDVSPHTPLPGPEGHKPVTVRIVHREECNVHVNRADELQICREPDGTSITLAPNPDSDVVTGEVSNAGASVTFRVTTQRVWWETGDEDQEPEQWSDSPVELHRRDFRATSHQALWIRYPEKFGGHHMFAGFRPEAARRYRLEKNERRVLTLPLRELGDSPELQRDGESALRVWLDAPSQAGCVVAKLANKFRCAISGCLFEASSVDDVLDHVAANHMRELIRRVTDCDELRQAVPELRKLPRYIHRCCKCDKYFPSEDNRPVLIFDHDCSKVRPHFEVIKDVDRVRRCVLRDLPEIYRCKWGCVLKGKSANVTHIMSQHRERLYFVE